MKEGSQFVSKRNIPLGISKNWIRIPLFCGRGEPTFF